MGAVQIRPLKTTTRQNEYITYINTGVMTAQAYSGAMYGEEARKGPWTVEEDMQLISYITHNGEGRWNFLAKATGLKRSGKSCRLRWVNYLRPDLKRGNITPDEERLIIDLQSRLGNRWSRIAQDLPGRTDNEIKNYWRTKIKRNFHRENAGNRSPQHSIYSNSMPNPNFMQQNSGMEEYGAPQNSIQLRGTHESMVHFDEKANEEFVIGSFEPIIRNSNRVNQFEHSSGVAEGTISMPHEVESFAGMVSELYADVMEDGSFSIPSCISWPEDILN